MVFAIMRCKKLGGMGSVAASLKHCFRERDTPNADASRTADNEHNAAKSTNEAMGKLRELLPEKRRKDAVLTVEYVMTASPEWWTKASKDEQADFFNQAHQWLVKKYGADRIITATIHRDEKTPHLSAFVVPLTKDGRLSAKDFIGNRTKMTADQTSFAKAVEHLGLQRGIERSKSTHTSIKQHYAAIQKSEIAGHVTITPESLKPRTFKREGIAEKLKLCVRVESNEGVAHRLTEAVNNALAATFAKASESVQNERRAKELSKTMAQQQKRLESLQAPFRGLAKNQIEDLLKQAIKLGQENQKIRAKQDQERQREISRSKSEHSWGR
jgi:hypothetical protein